MNAFAPCRQPLITPEIMDAKLCLCGHTPEVHDTITSAFVLCGKCGQRGQTMQAHISTNYLEDCVALWNIQQVRLPKMLVPHGRYLETIARLESYGVVIQPNGVSHEGYELNLVWP